MARSRRTLSSCISTISSSRRFWPVVINRNANRFEAAICPMSGKMDSIEALLSISTGFYPLRPEMILRRSTMMAMTNRT